MIAWKQYKPLEDIKYQKYYELYREFGTSMRSTKSDTKFKEYSKMRNKYEARLLVWLGVITQKAYDTMTF